jgi:CO/xanthine dehydrogenase Mo-binding subunit
VAIVAGENEKAVEEALDLIKVQYEVLQPVLDFRRALDHEVIIHPEENWKSLAPVGADNRRNLCASEEVEYGDVDQVISECEWIIEQTYHTKANQQVMMETFRTVTHLDTFGRLVCVSSTQVPFHVRRILANAIGIPKSQIRVIKPRIGGGFGAKQTAVSEIYPAIVTWKTGKPAMIIYTRRESFTSSSPRQEMEIRVRLEADKEGIIRGLDVYTLSNTGA